jgi:hypothetical protein
MGNAVSLLDLSHYLDAPAVQKAKDLQVAIEVQLPCPTSFKTLHGKKERKSLTSVLIAMRHNDCLLYCPTNAQV